MGIYCCEVPKGGVSVSVPGVCVVSFAERRHGRWIDCTSAAKSRTSEHSVNRSAEALLHPKEGLSHGTQDQTSAISILFPNRETPLLIERHNV